MRSRLWYCQYFSNSLATVSGMRTSVLGLGKVMIVQKEEFDLEL